MQWPDAPVYKRAKPHDNKKVNEAAKAVKVMKAVKTMYAYEKL